MARFVNIIRNAFRPVGFPHFVLRKHEILVRHSPNVEHSSNDGRPLRYERYDQGMTKKRGMMKIGQLSCKEIF